MSQSPWQNAPAPQATPGRTDTILAPSPMGIGALFRTAWRLLTAKVGLLLGLNLLQTAIMVAVTVVAALVGAAAVLGTIGTGGSPSGGQVATAVVIGLVLLLLALAVVFWVSIKFSAMSIAALDLRARGRESSWDSAAEATRGVVRRAVSVILIEVLAVAAVYLLFGLLFGASLLGNDDPGAGTVGAMVALGLLLGLAGLYVGVRLAYLNQVLAVERLGGMDVFRRAWQLTRGRFWPTLGRSFLGMLAPMVVLGILTGLQTGATGDRIDGTPANTGLAALLSAVIFVVELLSGIWMVAYVTTMYIDQVRRHAMAGISPVAVAPAQAAPTMAPTAPFDALGADTWGERPVGPLGTGVPQQPVAPAQPVTPAAPQQPSPWTAPDAQAPQPPVQQPVQPPTVPVDEDGNPWNRPSDDKGGL